MAARLCSQIKEIIVPAFQETYRGLVANWECDQYGHLNVQFYVGRISDAVASLLHAGGMGRVALEQRRLGIVAVNQNIDYLRELRAGTVVRMESAIRQVEGRKLVLHHRLFDAESGELAMRADVLGLCFDLEARKSVPLPDDLHAGFSALLMDGSEAMTQQALPVAEPGWMISHRSPVNTWECDRMGHLNVQFYQARAADADRHVFTALGLGPRALAALGLGLRPLRYRIQFRRELHNAAITVMRSAIRSADAEAITLLHELYDHETGVLSAVMESRIAVEDLASGRLAALPAAALRLAEPWIAAFPGGDALPSPGLPRPPENLRPGMYETCRGGVDQWECDENGRMAPRFYMARFSSAAMNVFVAADFDTSRMREAGLGSAALDYTIDVKQMMRVGQAFHCQTSVLELRDKTWRFSHLLLDSNSGETLAIAEVVAVFFDLKMRKAIAMPEPVRAGFTRHLLPPA